MRHDSHLLYDHNSQSENRAGFKETVRSLWKTALLVVLLSLVVITLVALESPDTVEVILGYFR